MTHDSFAVSAQIVAEFEAAQDARLVFLQAGDAGAALNKAILTRDTPLADVFFGVDNTFLSRALAAQVFEPYKPDALAEISPFFKLDPTNHAFPVDFADVCINYDRSFLAAMGLRPPTSLADLTAPEYRGLLVAESPATSSTGLAFLLATRAQFGDGFLQYWQEMKANGVVVVDGWETAYYTNFSGSSGRGSQPMVVSYASSPAAEVVFADPPVDVSPTGSILAPGTCFRQIELVGILRGTQHRRLAERFVDFMLAPQFQEDMPLQMFVYPVNPQASLPTVFVEHAAVAEQPATLSPEEIAAHRDEWIDAWLDVMDR